MLYYLCEYIKINTTPTRNLVCPRYITITHIAQDKIADIIHMSIFYESDPSKPSVVYHHPLTEVQTSEQFYALEKAENELKTELTKAGVQARIDEINEGGTLLECYVQFKTLLQKVATSMDDTAKSEN